MFTLCTIIHTLNAFLLNGNPNEYEKIELVVKDDALDYIAETALNYNLGARGLRSICEAIFMDDMYEMPSKKGVNKLVVDKNYAKNKLKGSRIEASLKVA